MPTTDCLIIGFNDSNFEEYVNMVGSMGRDSGAFKDLDLAFIEYAGKPRHSMDLLNYFYGVDKPDHRPFHNADFMWPVVLYLASYLSQRGYSFDFVNLFQQEQDLLREKLLHDDIRTIAITTTLYVSPHPILEIIAFIRQYNTSAQIIVGGPYISNQFKLLDGPSAQSLFQYLGADLYITCEEGPLALTRVITALKQNQPLEFIDNIAFRRGKDFFITQSSPESNSLEENMVNYSLFSPEQIGQFISTRTAKSCPYACAFCGFPQRAGKYTYTSVESVEHELNHIRDIGTVTTLTFLDDTFNVPKTRFKDILRMMIRNNYGFKWNSFYRSDQGDPETIALMREAGCEGVFLGAESGSDTMLQHMNKTSRRKDYVNAIKLFREAGISTYTSLIVGFPGETYATVQETMEFLEEAQPDFFRAQLWYCDPVTPIWKKRDEYGITGSAFNWSHNTMDYRIASDLIDRMFLSVESSIWLPQFGFEQWSTFYLQRQGMTMAQIKHFLRAFNTAIKEKIVYPGKRDVDPATIDSIRASSRFDTQQPVTLVDRFDPAGYKAAERFWTQQFRDLTPEPHLAALYQATPVETTDQATVTSQMDRAAIERLSTICAVDPAIVPLAALSILLSSLTGRQATTLVADLPDGSENSITPLKLDPRWELSFKDFAQEVQRRAEAARPHKLYGFHIVANPYRMDQHGGQVPVFDVAFSYTPQHSLADALTYYPRVLSAIQLELKIVPTEGVLQLCCVYNQGSLSAATVEQMATYLSTIIATAEAQPEITLKNIMPEGSAYDINALENDESEMFSF